MRKLLNSTLLTLSNMKRLILTLIFLVLLSSSINAATIKGSIYDAELNKVQNNIVTINTVPNQMFVSKDGNYELTVSKGDYTLKAEYQNLEDTQQIKVSEDETYNIDLILFPSTQDEEDLYDTTEVDVSSLDLNPKSYTDYIIYGLILILLIILAITFLKKKPQKLAETPKEDFITDDSEKVLSYLKKEQRATQKDIRKLLNLSEAKVSLIITELESKGKIKKIRKGRANIIISQQP
jgi:uncharacterized membrane protein